MAILLGGVLSGCSRDAAPSATTLDPLTQWCALAAELTSIADQSNLDQSNLDQSNLDQSNLDTETSSTGTERATLEKLVGVLERGKSIAPPEIAADVDTAAQRSQQIADLLASVDYDDSKISAETLAEYQTAGQELAQASAVITNFNQRYCGLGTNNPARDQAIANLVADGLTEQEASCLYDAIARERFDLSGTSDVSGAAATASVGGLSSGEELFASCGIDPERAQEIANVLVSDVTG